MADITPGQSINIKVVQKPTSIAAAKTIVRLLSKDPAVMAENERLRKVRKSNTRLAQRGGRMWSINVVKQRPVKAEIGETGTIRASVDVLRDLHSVERFLEIKAAS